MLHEVKLEKKNSYMKNFLIGIALYCIFDQTRGFSGIPITPTERMIGSEVGYVIHIAVLYVLPVYLIYKICRKIMSFVAARS